MKARFGNSNTTFVKVKSNMKWIEYSNTIIVNIKFNKINFYGFYYTAKEVDIQGV